MIVIAVIEIGTSTVITVENKGYFKWEQYYLSQPQFSELQNVVEVIKKEDAYKPQYAIELELKAYFNDESLQKGIFAIFHRGIKCGNREDLTDGYAKNDKAWDGFDFVDDGLPF
jgi:hypothetical protein